MENPNLNKKVLREDSKLKEIIVNYTGNKLNPEEDDITVHQVIEVFAEEFPEFVMSIAEENWISGYTQALKDVDFAKNNRSKVSDEKLSKSETK